jgi:hypothetical protein
VGGSVAAIVAITLPLLSLLCLLLLLIGHTQTKATKEITESF